jgi:hypothetical protein
MAQLTITEEGKIGAPADRVYTYIADMRKHHHHFLPANFSDFTVEEGGFGEGTVFRTKITFAGRSQILRMRVAEPTPGRVMTESNLLTPMVTIWTIIPDGAHCRVHLETKWDTARGFRGLLERL